VVEALSSYRGALIVVSHDEVLLDRLRVGSHLCLS
jgi:ATPase subunit of ABC transporter with duplicated ATPase domains